MALLRFSKKKNVVKRAWMSFANMVRSKVRELEIVSSVKDSTFRFLHVISRSLVVPFKTRYPQNMSPRTHFNNYCSNYGHHQRQHCRFLELFPRPFATTKCIRRPSESNYWQIPEHQSQSHGTIRSEEKVLGRKKEKEEDGPQESMEDAWRRVVAASPHLRVDERAGGFIYKVKEKMRMEKERSLLEFQERLIRSA